MERERARALTGTVWLAVFHQMERLPAVIHTHLERCTGQDQCQSASNDLVFAQCYIIMIFFFFFLQTVMSKLKLYKSVFQLI